MSATWRPVGALAVLTRGMFTVRNTLSDGDVEKAANTVETNAPLQAYLSQFDLDIPALCATVKHLRAEVAEYERTDLVPRSRYNAADAEAREAREQTKQLAQRAGAEIESLQSQLEQLREELAEEKRLRAELKQIAQIGISEVSSVGAVLKDNAVIDFRSCAVHLCKDKAAEYERAMRNRQTREAFTKTYADAANEIREALEAQ